MKTSHVRILIVEDVLLEAKLLTRALKDLGYAQVEHCADVASALALVETRPPQIIITDNALGSMTGCDLTRAIRARAGDNYIYLLMLTGASSDIGLREAFDAGVDDFVAKPLRIEELVARVRAGERILELETRLRIRSKELETALRRIDVAAAQRALAKASALTSAAPPEDANTGLAGLTSTRAWFAAEQIVAKATSDFLQLPFVSATVSSDTSLAFVADVLLSEPARQLEIGISVLTDDPSMRLLAMHLFGDEEIEGARALVLETSNIVMGAMKTALVECGHSFTAGIPTQVTFNGARQALDTQPVRQRMAFTCGGARLQIWLRAGEKKNTKLLAKNLVEGMIIVEDVHDARGMLLIRAGSRLTLTTAERIARFAPETEVVVGNPRG